jgi:hypothetical protein
LSFQNVSSELRKRQSNYVLPGTRNLDKPFLAIECQSRRFSVTAMLATSTFGDFVSFNKTIFLLIMWMGTLFGFF